MSSSAPQNVSILTDISANIFALLILFLIILLAAREGSPSHRAEAPQVIDIEKQFASVERSPLSGDELFDLLYDRREAAAATRIDLLAACRTEGCGGDFGAFEASLWLCAQLSSSQAGIRVNMRLMFHAMVTRLHSPRAFSRPRIENCRKPITDLMMPNTGSGVCLRSA
jgi:hypothetical protein